MKGHDRFDWFPNKSPGQGFHALCCPHAHLPQAPCRHQGSEGPGTREASALPASPGSTVILTVARVCKEDHASAPKGPAWRTVLWSGEEARLGSSSCPTGEERPEWPGVGGRALTPRPAGDSNPSPRRGYTPTGWKTGSSWGVGRCSPLAPGLALTPTHVAPPEDAQPGSGYTDSPNRNAHMSSGDPSEQRNPKGPTPGPCRAQAGEEESVIRSRDRTLTAATGAVGTWPAWQTPHAGRALSQADAHRTEYRHHMLRLHRVEAGGLGAEGRRGVPEVGSDLATDLVGTAGWLGPMGHAA